MGWWGRGMYFFHGKNKPCLFKTCIATVEDSRNNPTILLNNSNNRWFIIFPLLTNYAENDHQSLWIKHRPIFTRKILVYPNKQLS